LVQVWPHQMLRNSKTMNENISLGEAFRYCASFPSYWIWIGAFIVALICGLIAIEKVAVKEDKDLDGVKLFWVVIFILLLAGAIFKNPTNVRENTTKEQAARGVYIGF